MPLYGRTFKLFDKTKVHPGDKANGGGPKYPTSNETGIIGYIEVFIICFIMFVMINKLFNYNYN